MKPGLLVVLVASTAHADSRLISDDTFNVTAPSTLSIDGGLVVALPSALPSGMATGLGAGVTRECSCWWGYGGRLSVATVTESSEQFIVTHDEFRLRGFGELHHRAGRGTIAVRLSLGPSFVREDRVRAQAGRAGVDPMETTALAALPAGELEGVIALKIVGPWSMVASGGPTLDVFDGHLHGGWTASLGVGWQP